MIRFENVSIEVRTPPSCGSVAIECYRYCIPSCNPTKKYYEEGIIMFSASRDEKVVLSHGRSQLMGLFVALMSGDKMGFSLNASFIWLWNRFR